MKFILLSAVWLFCFTGCKTKQHTESHNDIRKIYSEEYLLTRLIGIQINDSLKQRIFRELSGKIVLWSSPDSTGFQYKTADIEFSSNTEEETAQGTQLSLQDTTSVKTNSTADMTDQSVVIDLKESDSRIINNNLLSWIIGIISGLWIIIVLFRFFIDSKNN
jgi:UPF0288 family protein (methanogenesis marker protein 3)